MQQLVAITGGPGAGKTTLIEALAAQGHAVRPEAGRAIIQAAAEEGEPHPWADPRDFARRMLEFDRRSYESALDADGPVFFDRGVPDIAGYLRLVGLPPSGDIDRAARSLRYHPTAFIAPPWIDIYAQDQHRTQTFEEAMRTCAMIAEAYADYGYTLVELPRATVEARVRFVLRTLGLQVA